MRLSSVTLLVVFVVAWTNVHAATLRVPAQHATVQAAINAAVAGDTVLVAAGTYLENIIFYGKAITVISEFGPAVTILDGGGLGAVVTFTSGEGLDSVLSGFTIRNGSSSLGSGISVQFSAATIVSNIFTNNVAPSGYFGAGIAGFSATVVIEKNVFRNNRTDNQTLAGVVTFVNASSPRIANNLFYDNLSRAIVIDLPSDRSAVVINNTIVGNEAGIKVNNNIDTSGQLYFNNLIVSNKIGLQTVSSLPPTWAHNLVAGNQTDYVGTTNQTGINGNISTVPLFACADAHDFRLLSGSPGIDAGTNSVAHLPTTDFDGRPRVIAAVVDIGAFEFDPLAPVRSCAPPTLRVPTQYTNIQAAINAAAMGDVVLVAPGTYFENISFIGKAITVISEAGPAVTILDGQRAGAVVAFGSGETRSSVLSGFTVRNGGSGIALSGASATIVSNIFENNDLVAGYFGAAIGGLNASPVVEKNIFRRNSTDDDFLVGVVSFVATSSPRIANNIFYDNAGRAINMTVPGHASPVIVNNTIVRNRVGVRVDGRVDVSASLFFNNIVAGNEVGLFVEFGSPPTWRNNLLGGNATDYVGIGSQAGTNGNIAGFPSFRCLRSGLTLDLRLLPGSVGIDAGNNSAPQLPAEDFAGHARILAGQSNGVPIVDMGAFEFDPSEPIGVCPGPDVFCAQSTNPECNGSNTVPVTALVLHSTGYAMTVLWRLNGAEVQTNAIPATGTPTRTNISLTVGLLLGTNVIDVTVTDSAQNTESCTTTLVLSDTVAPTLSCPPDQIADFTGKEGAVVTYEASATDACSAVTLNCEPLSGSTFPIGTTLVACVATDASGNQAQCSFQITVRGALSIKATVLSKLEARAVIVGDYEPALPHAINRLRRSVSANLWLDETHLKKDEGASVFLNEAVAVQHLKRVLRGHGINTGENLEEYIDRLVSVDRTLAELVIAEAIEAGVEPHKIQAASDKLSAGDLAGNQQRSVRAILLYQDAWRIATRALFRLQTP